VDLSRAAVYTSLASADIAELRGTLFDNRFWGALYCIKNAHGLLAEAGSITVTTGTVVKRGQKGFAFPAGAGGALAASVRTLAIDLAPVRVNVIGPGLVQTEMWAVRDLRDAPYAVAAANTTHACTVELPARAEGCDDRQVQQGASRAAHRAA
jgi:NAD(P)-dependent dehydrogenase (short-subunit alcohol dehydrogenase family)